MWSTYPSHCSESPPHRECLTSTSLTFNTVMTILSSSAGYTTSSCWQNDDSVSNLTQRGWKQNSPYPTHRPRVSSLCGKDVIKWHDIPSRRRHGWKKERRGLRQHWLLASHKSAGLTGEIAFRLSPLEKEPR